MADDDTWLDRFPVARTDYPLPFDMQLQTKPAYWGIVDLTQLPCYGLAFTSSNQKTAPGMRTLTLTATNGAAGPAYNTLNNGIQILQTQARRCSPVLTASTFPMSLGDIATSSSAAAVFTIDFLHCSEFSVFILKVPWSSSTYETGTYKTRIEYRKGRD